MISLITVTYNSSKTLRDTLNSVLYQSYSNIEYLIIDGASQDGTVEIIKEFEILFGGRMRWISEKDHGLYDAMNKGIEMATGEVVGFINSDDLFASSTAIEEVMQCFKRNEPIDCVYANLYYVAQENTNKIIRHWISGNQRPFAEGWHPAHPTFYCKKTVYESYGGFDLEYKLAADFELMLRFIEKKRISIVYLPKPLVCMRLGGATSKNLTNILKGNFECIRAFKKNEIRVKFYYPICRIFLKLKQYFQ